MRGGFRIGRLFGINIGIDWSWLLIFLLVTWNLATVFSQVHPAWGPALNWGIAAVAAILFFASVLAHELAHSLVAKAQGLPVRNITLFLFGGVSNIEREPPSPGAEFLITVVGPITSIVLGVLFIIAANLSAGGLQRAMINPQRALAGLDPLTTLLLWLGPINILVGIFNLIPGFPLDGGRLLRSILWAITNNLRRATRWASYVGQAIAWLMIIAGIAMVFGVRIPFFGTGVIGGLWLAFIGWFLNNAAVQSYQQVVVQDVLEGVPVARLMRADVPTVPPEIPVSALVYDHVMGTDERAFPVLDGDRLVGLVTLEDVREVPRDQWDTTSVGQIMTRADQLVVVSPQEDAGAALNKLMQRDVRQVPVMENNHLVGIMRRRDIMRWLQMHSELVAR
ncbi:MAG: site-2 protease family protein [Ardenticatenaceae bacterium]|nr:site-2 protease family protein [Ardenticatenaceae bacterium]HBY94417.1 peptidase M50 [Chloroflexota bacterium]